LAMVNMTNRPDVAVRLRPLKLRFGHRPEFLSALSPALERPPGPRFVSSPPAVCCRHFAPFDHTATWSG
ncbi:hypothetical protein, partial [Microbaculum marinum]